MQLLEITFQPRPKLFGDLMKDWKLSPNFMAKKLLANSEAAGLKIKNIPGLAGSAPV